MAEFFGLYRNDDRTDPVESQTRDGGTVRFEINNDDSSDPKTLYAIGDDTDDLTKDYGFGEITVTAVGVSEDKWEFREDENDSWSNTITITDINQQVQSFDVRVTSDADEQTKLDEDVEIEIDAEVAVV